MITLNVLLPVHKEQFQNVISEPVLLSVHKDQSQNY